MLIVLLEQSLTEGDSSRLRFWQHSRNAGNRSSQVKLSCKCSGSALLKLTWIFEFREWDQKPTEKLLLTLMVSLLRIKAGVQNLLGNKLNLQQTHISIRHYSRESNIVISALN